jgi:hypothetical protein
VMKFKKDKISTRTLHGDRDESFIYSGKLEIGESLETADG